ncbi:hypothetical protein J1614_006965 [Plenodomus biglobosus]|nr:hypothetical protein J1614_006965 [Plenodomus biglobosus]
MSANTSHTHIAADFLSTIDSPPAALMTSSPLLALPRELRDAILGHLTQPAHVFTSSTTADSNRFSQFTQGQQTYVDIRIYLPTRLPANILATCAQLRQEALYYHGHQLNTRVLPRSAHSKEPMSVIIKERVNAEFEEVAERACDDGVLRITLEVERRKPGSIHTGPTRDQLSPRFLALLPLMQPARKLTLHVWAGYQWWNGGPPPVTSNHGNLYANVAQVSRPNALTVAIGRILERIPYVEELTINAFILGSEAGVWDLPDRKWESLQPWLDTPIAVRSQTLAKVTRTLSMFVRASVPESFYTQLETRQNSGPVWKVERKGDMYTVSYSEQQQTICSSHSP